MDVGRLIEIIAVDGVTPQQPKMRLLRLTVCVLWKCSSADYLMIEFES